MFVHVRSMATEAREGSGSPETIVKGGGELITRGAGERMWVVCLRKPTEKMTCSAVF